MQLQNGKWSATIVAREGVMVTCYGASEAEAVADANIIAEKLKWKNEVTV